VESNRKNLSEAEIRSAYWLLDMRNLCVERHVQPSEAGYTPDHYTEEHHIIPKSVNGHHSNKENLIALTYQNHVRSHGHMALVFGNYALQYAFVCMANTSKNMGKLKDSTIEEVILAVMPCWKL
jgi:hypothetical protein